jgi:hypothetical protein
MSESFVIIGILLFVVLMLPVLLVRDYRQKRKIRQILEAYRERKAHDTLEPEAIKAEQEEAPEGWGMNNSPFRERKSGLSWGGGNIKASDATRGTKRKLFGR